jgi:hypothetical protein
MPAPRYYPTFPVQPPLMDLPAPLPGEPSPLQKRFEEFHQNNPQIYERLRALAFARQAMGAKRWGIKAIFELLRWGAPLHTHGEVYKLCNTFHAYYARLLMEREPRLQGFFVTKKQRD